MSFRSLFQSEISELLRQGCTATDWKTVFVKDPFYVDRVKNVHFSGEVHLGAQMERVDDSLGISRPCGLFQTHLHNCFVGDNVLIFNVQRLANYHIEDRVVIENVNELVTTGSSQFGQGVTIAVLNESGERAIPIFDQLSSQIAYMLTVYRHDNEFIQAAFDIIHSYCQRSKNSIGKIQKKARISNCKILRNLIVGQAAIISGAERLENGSIISTSEAPTIVGNAVIARDFIIQSGSIVDGGSVLDHCFIGQGVKIGKQFSAENSAFFANSEAFHGEACSVFAGPYTVTHHKSTLLIAGMFSFYNAGSGSNQSNHLYKLGPVHQGILERGAKTGSFSYLVWPGHIGAFSIVIGKHQTNLDTADFPFSYILESAGKTVVIPAINLFTIGTKRDTEKWPQRDRRKGEDRLDLLHFDWLNPRVVEKMLNGISTLQKIQKSSTKDDSDLIFWNGFYLKGSKIQFALESYECAVNIFCGNLIIDHLLGKTEPISWGQLLQQLQPKENPYRIWADIAGMVAPVPLIEQLMGEIRSGTIGQLEQWRSRLAEIHDRYNDLSWAFAVDLLEQRLGKPFSRFEPDDFFKQIELWEASALKLNENILADAKKEFDDSRQIGYGLDGDEAVKSKDFAAVRGKIETNSVIQSVAKEKEQILERAKTVKEVIAAFRR